MCDDEVSGDATAGALRNPVVLRNIFQYLPTSSLLICSRVNQLWRQEARSFIRDFRECTIKLGYHVNLWKIVFELNKVLGGMSVIPFNSLDVILLKENVVCKEDANVNALTNLITKFPLKFLSVYEDVGLKARSSPAASAVLELVRRNSSLLVELEIRSRVKDNKGLFKDWQPTEKFEKLEKLSIGQNSSVTAECAKKIIRGAPNLRSIHNNCAHMIRDNVIPQNMYGTLKRLAITLEDMDLIEKCADKLVHLEELMVQQAGYWLRENLISEDEDANKRRFFRLCRQVSSLNALTVGNLDIRLQDNFLLSQLELPVLPAVRNLYLTVYNISEDLEQILFINFPETLPNLRKVHIREDDARYEDFDNGDMIPEEDIMAVASQTTLELVIEHTIHVEDAVTLHRLFPNVITLSVTLYTEYGRSSHIPDLWPHLQRLHVRTTVSFPLQQIGPEVFGLHPEELELLHGQDKEFLKRVHVPPSRPCVATLEELKHFKLEYVLMNDPGWVETFRELVESLLIGRRPGLNFHMEPETGGSTPRFGDIADESAYDPIEDSDSEDDAH